MKAWKPVQNLIFDLDDTLYQRRDPYLAAFHACFGQIQGLDEDALFRESRIIGDEEYARRIRGEISMREMEVRRTTRTLQKFGIPVTNEEAIRFERAYQEALKTIRVNAGMQKVLDLAGKQGQFLGILTNGPRERQLGKFEALGLSRWIPKDRLVISSAVGASKPDPAIFRAMEERFCLDPESTCMIGDSEETDIRGAKRAGWHTILFAEPFLAQHKEETEADAVAEGEAGLLALLREDGREEKSI